MSYPNDLTKTAVLEILEWWKRDSCVTANPDGGYSIDEVRLEELRQLYERMTADTLKEILPDKEDTELLLAMESWSGVEFVAICARWPLELGEFLFELKGKAIGTPWGNEEVTHPAPEAVFHVSRSSDFGPHSRQAPAAWLDWAKERMLEVPITLTSGPGRLSAPEDKPVGTQERKTFLAIIYVMSTGKYGWSFNGNSTLPKTLENKMDGKAHSVDAETIRGKLRAAYMFMEGHED